MRSVPLHRRALVIAVTTVFLLSVVTPPFVSAQQRTATQQQSQVRRINVAVLDFDARSGIGRGEAATLSDAFQTELVSLREFNVVDRTRLRQILEEQGFQQSEACSQVECIVEAGKILKVERMFAGTIGKVGSLFNVNIQVIDIGTAQIVANKSRQYRGDIEDLLSDMMPEMARELATDLTGKRFAAKSGGGSWLWYALGAVVLGGGGAGAYLFLKGKKEALPVVEPPQDLPTPPLLP